MSDLITIAAFPTPAEAYMAKAKLDSEGIRAAIVDENIVAMDWLYTNLVGQVKLQVLDTDADRARAILATIESRPDGVAEVDEITQSDLPVSEPLDPEGPGPEDLAYEGQRDPVTECPYCGSRDITYEKYHRGVFAWTFILLRVAIPWPRLKWKCHKCGRTWKARSEAERERPFL